MKQRMQAFALVAAMLCTLAACDVPATSAIETSSAATPSTPSALPAESTPLTTDAIINHTEDLTITIDVTGGHGLEAEYQACEPGGTLPLDLQISGFFYEGPALDGAQSFEDLYWYCEGDALVRFEFSGDAQSGYGLQIYEGEVFTPVHQYLWEPVQAHWIPCRPGQKLFIDDLPDAEWEDIMALYPGAVLRYGEAGQRGWPDGFSMLLFCHEPLYNLKWAPTYFEEVTAEGDILYSPVDWDALEGTGIQPGAPIFLPLYSVGSAWNLALRFEDADGQQFTYLLGENGRGGDWPSLHIYQVEDVHFTA